MTAQIVCEAAIYMIARHSPAEALDLLRDAFHSTTKAEPLLTALYANLTTEVPTHLLVSALRDLDLPTALEYTDASVFSPSGDSGNAHKEQLELRLEEIYRRTLDRTNAVKANRVVTYGDILAALQSCSDVGFNDVGPTAPPKKSPVIAPPKKSLAETQRALTADAAIVEYATIRDQVIVFVIRRNDVQAVFLYASTAEIKNAVHAMRHADNDRFAAAASRLYELILAPFAARLEGVSTIAVIPYRDLLGIPFGALLDVQRGQFLTERFAVVHAQSTRAAISASRASKPAREQKMLAIAATEFNRERYPNASALPAARREADSIATLSSCAQLLVGPTATPEAIQRQLVENVVIHYAGHIVRRGSDVWLPLIPPRAATAFPRLKSPGCR